jgi:tungstate transport system permease protein
MPQSLWKAFEALVSLDREVYFIVLTSLRISTLSTVIAAALSMPLGVWLGLTPLRGKKPVIAVLNSLMALPTVVIGLFVYSLISRSGPLGGLGFLFTPAAIVIGQVILSFPIIASMVYSALSRLDPRLPETLVTLGASRVDTFWMVIRESKIAILSAVLAGFGRVIGEVGVSMMLGGNIRWYTRTITTAIALETSKGEFELGLALGIILMLLAIGINFMLHWLFRRES